MQAVHDGFPGYIIVAADQSAYPMAVYGTNLGNGISVLADIRIVELALDESIQDAMDKALTAAIQSSLGSDYPDLNINVASTMITGNVDISLPGTKNVTGGPVDGVISAMARTSAEDVYKRQGMRVATVRRATSGARFGRLFSGSRDGIRD